MPLMLVPTLLNRSSSKVIIQSLATRTFHNSPHPLYSPISHPHYNPTPPLWTFPSDQLRSAPIWRSKPFAASISVRSSSSYNGDHSQHKRYGTTILCIRRNDKVVLAGDGQVTQNNMCIKPNARKLRKLSNGKVITGFAGTTADAFTLLERLEGKLDEHPGQLLRACVELAKMWRTDRYLKNLEAVMIVADESLSLEVTGNGDVLESHDGVIGVGSGGSYAIAAARALYENTNMDAKSIAERAMKIAADLCIYTNHNLIFEELNSVAPRPDPLSPLEASTATQSGATQKPEDNNAPDSPPATS